MTVPLSRRVKECDTGKSTLRRATSIIRTMGGPITAGTPRRNKPMQILRLLHEAEQVAETVRSRRDERDDAGDPEDLEEAMGIIAHQDEEISALLDMFEELRSKLLD